MNSTYDAQVRLRAVFFVNGPPNKFNLWWRIVLILANFTFHIYCSAQSSCNAPL